MSFGPVVFIVVLPGNTLSGDITAHIQELVRDGTIRVVDLLFVTKNDAGDIAVIEVGELDDDAYGTWDAVVGEVAGYLTADDAHMVAGSLEPGNSAVLTLVENSWAQRLVAAISDANGSVLISERIPRPVVEELIAQHG